MNYSDLFVAETKKRKPPHPQKKDAAVSSGIEARNSEQNSKRYAP